MTFKVSVQGEVGIGPPIQIDLTIKAADDKSAADKATTYLNHVRPRVRWVVHGVTRLVTHSGERKFASRSEATKMTKHVR